MQHDESNTPETATPAPVPDVDPAAVQAAVEPKAGKEYTFGGKTFYLTYLSIDGQDTLDRLLAPWFSSDGKGTAEAMEDIKGAIPKAAALILAEQDPEVTEKWLRSLKEEGARQRLFELVMDQVGLDQVGKFYATLSYAVASLRRSVGTA